MTRHYPSQIIAYHSCDKRVGLRILTGDDSLKPSNNSWDWLGHGIYFWEYDPLRALKYAKDCSTNLQFNKVPIETPIVIGAIIDLGTCLNLLHEESLELLSKAHKDLDLVNKLMGKKMPENAGNIRRLDCAVIRFIQETNDLLKELPYDTVRCSFDEGDRIYPGANFSNKNHIQVCVVNPSMIKGYFLSRPLELYNPYLHEEFSKDILSENYGRYITLEN